MKRHPAFQSWPETRQPDDNARDVNNVRAREGRWSKTKTWGFEPTFYISNRNAMLVSLDYLPVYSYIPGLSD